MHPSEEGNGRAPSATQLPSWEGQGWVDGPPAPAKEEGRLSMNLVAQVAQPAVSPTASRRAEECLAAPKCRAHAGWQPAKRQTGQSALRQGFGGSWSPCATGRSWRLSMNRGGDGSSPQASWGRAVPTPVRFKVPMRRRGKWRLPMNSGGLACRSALRHARCAAETERKLPTPPPIRPARR